MTGFPTLRLRRLRSGPALRGLLRENRLALEDLVQPLFVVPGEHQHQPIASMPGCFRFSVDTLVEECRALFDEGLRAILLFGIPEEKDAAGSGGWADNGIVQRALRALRKALPELVLITDVCLCEYTEHGHCGPVTKQGRVDNDAALPLLARCAVSQARAGADIVAPSDMMDGRVGAIRAALDAEGFHNTPILSYAAKFASAFYGPFREAAGSAPRFGDRRSYQMDPANGREALREIALDIEEGADIVMIKPGLAYLDLLRQARDRFDLPLAVYNVSGEYAMLKAAADQGLIDERATVLETLTAFKRAGANLILSYHARDAARWLRENEF